jgi:hypothetical protein
MMPTMSFHVTRYAEDVWGKSIKGSLSVFRAFGTLRLAYTKRRECRRGQKAGHILKSLSARRVETFLFGSLGILQISGGRGTFAFQFLLSFVLDGRSDGSTDCLFLFFG